MWQAMIIVIGGAHQGKLAYARQMWPGILWADGKVCGEEKIFHCGGIYDFQEYIAGRMREGGDLSAFPRRLFSENPRIIIVADEIGYGIVPAERKLREYRETTGRVLTELAAMSAQVHRVVCGIGIRIK